MQKKKSAPALSEGGLELVAARFKALSEPSRLRLMMCLAGGEKNVTELIEETGLGQANVSRQLRVLLGAGVLSRRKEGLNVYYEVADRSIFEVCHLMCGSMKKRLEKQAGVFR